MKNRIMILITSFIFIVSCSQEQPKDIIGIWQDSYVVASGWRDNYQFFVDGTFRFNYNQMLCDKRTIQYSGTWKLEDNILNLTTNQKIVHEGGTLIESTGSCASDYEIEGGEIKTINLDKPESTEIKLTGYKTDKKHDNLEQIKFDNKKFWRMAKEPDNY